MIKLLYDFKGANYNSATTSSAAKMALSVTVEVIEEKCLQVLVAQWSKRPLSVQIAEMLMNVNKFATTEFLEGTHRHHNGANKI